MFRLEDVETIPHIRDKAIVDFVNGMGMAKDLNQVDKKHFDLPARILDLISGKSHQRQINMNDSFIKSFEACKEFLKEINQDITQHSRLVTELSRSLQETQCAVAEIANELEDLKKYVDKRFSNLEKEVRRLTESDEINFLLDKWRAGDFSKFSPIARAYIVLDSLYWKGINVADERVTKSVIAQLKVDLKTEHDTPLNSDHWLAYSSGSQSEPFVLHYLGNWCLGNQKILNMTFLATQWAYLSHPSAEEYLSTYQENKPEYLTIYKKNKMLDITRITTRMIDDFNWRNRKCLN